MYFRVTLLLVLLCFACDTKNSNKANSSNSNHPDVIIGSVPWSEDIAITQLAKKIIESKGYSVQIKTVESLTKALYTEKIDLSLSEWFPQSIHVTMSSDFIVIGDTYQHSKMGVIVPDYSPINSLADLENNTNYKDITIYRPINGNESARAANEIMKRYQFKFTNEERSDSLTATYMLDRYKKKKDFFVIVGYPHPVFASEHLKMLDDPYHAFEESYDVVKICSKRWSDNHPQLYQFINKFQLHDKDFEGLVKHTKANNYQLDKAIGQWYEQIKPQFIDLLKEK
ncbi:glycine betaine ABC transporter substrate-binding protein [Prolixibacteraceae bacterium]|nr:glycine betaine ABC transporter substrate-binding protein [Prolixibacteraceae bacterium]